MPICTYGLGAVTDFFPSYPPPDDPTFCVPGGGGSNVINLTGWFWPGVHIDCCDPTGMGPFGQGDWFINDDYGNRLDGVLCTCSGSPCTAWGWFCSTPPSVSGFTLWVTPPGTDCNPPCALLYWNGTGYSNVYATIVYDVICWSLTYQLSRGVSRIKHGAGRYPTKIILPEEDALLDSSVLVEDGILIPRDKYDLKTI